MMSERSRYQADDVLFDQAALWLFRLQADDVSVAEREAFEQWSRQSADHQAAWAEAQALYGALKEPARVLYQRQSVRSKRASKRGRWALGLCFGALAMVAAFIQGPVVIDRLQADYVTAVGQRQTVQLEDGSQVSLNTDSAIRVGFDDRMRVITLLRGEAYFQVVADKARPFHVETDQGRVTAVGTAFAVRQSDGNTALVVTEGVVSVHGKKSGDHSVTVPHGQNLRFTEDTIEPPQVTATKSVLAWREGKAVFRQRPLRQVIGELDRYWSGVTLVLDQDLAEEPVSGVIDLERRDASLNALAVLLGAEVTEITPYFALIHRN
jgi:transmembrane sensor